MPALVLVCVDPRLNHELIRVQIRQKLERSGISGRRIYVLNGIGGNPGDNLRTTVQLLERAGDPVVFGAVLHHDDCLAAAQGQRLDLRKAASQMTEVLRASGSNAPVLTGHIRTEHNQVLWDDEPTREYAPFQFGFGSY